MSSTAPRAAAQRPDVTARPAAGSGATSSTGKAMSKRQRR